MEKSDGRGVFAERVRSVWITLVDSGTPGRTADAIGIMRSRMIMAGAVIAMPVLLLYIALMLNWASWVAAGAYAILAVCLVGNAWLHTRGQSTEASARVALFCLSSLCSVVWWQTGGFPSMAFSAALLIPMSAALLMGARGTLVWTAATGALVGVFWGFDTAGVELPWTLSGTWSDVGPFVFFPILISAALLLVAFVTLQKELAAGVARTADEKDEEAIRVRLLLEIATLSHRGEDARSFFGEALPMIRGSLALAGAAVWRSDARGGWERVSVDASRELADLGEGIEPLPIPVAEYVRRHSMPDPVWLPLGNANDAPFALQLFPVAPQSTAQAQFSQLIAGQLSQAIDRSHARREVQRLAFTDPLTELPNRSSFQQRLAEAIGWAKIHEANTAVLFIDLDGFKPINDRYGHDTGDLVLQLVSRRLMSALRLSDAMDRLTSSPGDLVSRLGGDEFTILLSEVQGIDGCRIVAQRIQSALSEPFVVQGIRLEVGVSIGVAVFPGDGKSADELVRAADVAMYEAKRGGRGGIWFYHEVDDTDSQRRRWIADNLPRALWRGDAYLVYQPIFPASGGPAVAVEALFRWTDPERGALSTPEVIRVAEESQEILVLGRWVIERACAQMQKWMQAGHPAPRLALNVSALQFASDELVPHILDTAARFGCTPGQIEIELTESILIGDEASVDRALRALNEAGIGVVLDDFGTGFSSLAYLKRFPISRLKIDQSFVADLPEGSRAATITRAILALARSLEMSVVAEGVETEEQLGFLRAEGCHEIQGYLLGRPLPGDEVTRYLAPPKPD